MREYFTEALVLDREDSGETDSRVHLFTEALGRITAKATSARKITSKLSAHLEPLNLIQVRLVETKGFQVADAIAFGKLGSKKLAAAVELVELIKATTALEHPDSELWGLVKKGELLSRAVLKQLGFDPEYARCADCGRAKPNRFVIRDAHYICENCFRRAYKSSDSVSLAAN